MPTSLDTFCCGLTAEELALLNRRRRRKVPKEFLKPRPMSGPVPRRARFKKYLPLQAVATALGVAIGLVSTWSPIDEWWYATLLRTTVDTTPSEQTTLLSVSPSTIQAGHCGSDLARVLTLSGARAGLLLSPTDSLCPSKETPAGVDAELIPPIEGVPDELFRRQGLGTEVVGLNPDAVSPLLDSLGLDGVRWLQRRAAGTVPSLSLERVAAGELDGSLLRGRVAIVALARDGADVAKRERAEAAVLSAALDKASKYPTARWVLVSTLLALISVVTLVSSRYRTNLRVKWGLALGLCVGVATALFAAVTFDLLFPLPSCALGLLVGWFVAELPDRLAERRADRSAEELLRKASRQLQVRAPPYLDEDEFWQNLARKASQAHPADEVLVAELPPFSWRLKVWPNGELDESVIKERRRDIRRTPYANRQGVPVASVTHDYLVMKGVPTVLVPIAYRGEVEGYLMLIGQDAADYFNNDPSVAQNLADDMANLVRQRRQVLLDDEGYRHPATLPGRTTRATAAEEVLTGARTALAELHLVSSVLQAAPVALCYADPFGDVRILGRAWLEWVPRLSAELRPLGPLGTLKPGELSLRQLVGAISQQVGKAAPLLSGLDSDGFQLDVPVSKAQNKGVKALRMRVFRLEENEGEVGGFMAALMELPATSDSLVPRASAAPSQGTGLTVFSLARLLQRMVSSLSSDSRSKVKLQTPREPAHVVGYRAELKEALEDFLIAAGSLAGKASGPIVSVREFDHRVQVRLLDLKLGAPAAALERTVLAPSVPPPGLASLGNLVRAVENSHGYVEVRTDDSWGLELELNFVRARPRIENPDAVLENLKRHNRGIKV